MKILIAVLLLLLISLFFFLSNRQQDLPIPISKGEQLVNSLLAKTAKIIKSTYNLKPCAVGAAMPGGPIRKLNLCFDTKSSLTEEQLRELLIKIAHELLNQVNEDEEIQEFLYERPFTIKNVQIIIYNHDKKGREVYDPEIATAQICGGVLTYRTVNPTNHFQFYRQFEESYEEALELMQKSSQTNSENKY
ncbi:MAG: hypothetical protein FJZ58_00710 [Chlamydiae bacterium]|nr:hypothetical protein [Chlamydiota bacterium]